MGRDRLEVLAYADHVQLRQADRSRSRRTSKTPQGAVEIGAVIRRLDEIGYRGSSPSSTSTSRTWPDAGRPEGWTLDDPVWALDLAARVRSLLE